jgi:hypothetical protein
MMRLLRWFGGLVAVGVLSLAVMIPGAVAQVHVDLRAQLNGSVTHPDATGFSTYDRGGGQREVLIVVRHIPELARHRVVFSVAGQRVGSRRVSADGVARFQAETVHGQFVPFAVAGNKVVVKTATTHRFVAVGTYHLVS